MGVTVVPRTKVNSLLAPISRYMTMCVVVGPSGSGKTTLLKRIQSCSLKGSWSDLEPIPVTVPTVGTNLVNISVGKKKEATVRELGGEMAPVWPKYFKDCSAVVFIIDASNRHQVSAATVLLLDVLTAVELQKASVLIIINKRDTPASMTRTELQAVMRLDDIIRNAQQPALKVVECSAKDGGPGLTEAGLWFQQQLTRPPTSLT